MTVTPEPSADSDASVVPHESEETLSLSSDSVSDVLPVSEKAELPSQPQDSDSIQQNDSASTTDIGLTGLAALAEEIDGQVPSSSLLHKESENDVAAVIKSEQFDSGTVQEVSQPILPSETEEVSTPDIQESSNAVEADTEEIPSNIDGSEQPIISDSDKIETLSEETPSSTASNPAASEKNESDSNMPLDEMMRQVDSHLDTLSSSLFAESNSATEETERRIRIAEAVEAQEKAAKRKKRKRRASITAIVLMLAAALGAIFLLARSFGFEGFSFSEIGDFFYDTVFSKVFSDDNEEEDTPNDTEETKEVSNNDDAEEPTKAEKSEDTDDHTTDPNSNTTVPDTTEPNTTESTNSTPNTGTPNTNSDTTTPDTNNNTSTDSSSSDGGTSGDGSTVSSPNAGVNPSTTYKTMISNCTWQQADFVARESGGHLVTISNEEELQQVIALAEQVGASYVWLGAYRNAANAWVWVTGESFTYAPWQSGEPSRVGANGEVENYLILCKVINDGTVSWVYRDVCNDPLSLSPQSYSGKMIYIIEYD